MKTKLDAIGEIYGINRKDGEDDEELRRRLNLITHRGAFEIVEFVTATRPLTRWEHFKAFILGKRFVHPKPHHVQGAFHVVLWGGDLATEQNATEVWATIQEYKPAGILASLWINGKQFR